MTKEQQNIDRALELRIELFDIANAFAVSKHGNIAVMLHESCNYIIRAGKITDNQDPYDEGPWQPSWHQK